MTFSKLFETYRKRCYVKILAQADRPHLKAHHTSSSPLTTTSDNLRAQRWLSRIPITTKKPMWKPKLDHSSMSGAQTTGRNGF